MPTPATVWRWTISSWSLNDLMRHAGGYKQALQSGAQAVALAGVVALSACERHDEAAIRTMVENWFDLGETLYFRSEQSCTAAVFRLRSDLVKSALLVENDAERAVFRLADNGVLALQVVDLSADQMANDLMAIDKGLGLDVLTATTIGKTCMTAMAQNTMFQALAEPHTILVYDRAAHATGVFVPTLGVVVIASGES